MHNRWEQGDVANDSHRRKCLVGDNVGSLPRACTVSRTQGPTVHLAFVARVRGTLVCLEPANVLY